VLDYQADLDAQVAKEIAWREDDQEYIRRRDALFARNLQVSAHVREPFLNTTEKTQNRISKSEATCWMDSAFLRLG